MLGSNRPSLQVNSCTRRCPLRWTHLARLLAPEVLVICEGSQTSDRIPVWDERIYRQIFRDLMTRVEFRSSGGKGELERAASIASVIAPGTCILKLRDRDDLTPEGRIRLLEDDPNLRVLKLRSLESYLLDDEVSPSAGGRTRHTPDERSR